jgi:hypothetical protein
MIHNEDSPARDSEVKGRERQIETERERERVPKLLMIEKVTPDHSNAANSADH